MKKAAKTKLNLHKETLANLDTAELGKALGGVVRTTIAFTECYTDCSCPNTE